MSAVVTAASVWNVTIASLVPSAAADLELDGGIRHRWRGSRMLMVCKPHLPTLSYASLAHLLNDRRSMRPQYDRKSAMVRSVAVAAMLVTRMDLGFAAAGC